MTPDQMKRKLAAILSADVKGYSRLMGEDEEWTLRTLNSYKGLIRNLVGEHRGRVVASPGDNVLAEFASVVDAVECAVEIQQVLKAKNAILPETRKMTFRIGINLGDVIEEADSIYGDGVNIAARLEGLAEPGGISLSESAFRQIENKIPLHYDYQGEHQVKNIARPVRVYRARIDPEAAPSTMPEEKKPSRKRISRVVLAGIALVLITAAAILYLFAFHPSASKKEVASREKMAFPLPDKPSIAVLPFTNLSGDPKQEFFSDGITEDIITALSKNPEIFVIARNSTFSYKGKAVEAKQVSEELGVRYVLEGSVQKSGSQVRITAQLIDALKGHNLWAERYERDLKDLFALQDEVTLKILMGLQVKLTEGGQASTAEKHFRGKEGLECYLKVIESSYYQRIFSIEGNNKSRQIAEEIVSMCPGNPFGYLLLGWAYRFDLMRGSSMAHQHQESFKKVMELAQKALTIDESLSSAHSLLIHIYIYKREFDKAIAEGERAVALDPNGANAYEHYAHSLLYANRFKEAIPAIQKAIRLNPIGSTSAYSTLGDAYANTGRLKEAVSAFKQALLMSPDNLFAHLGLSSTYIEMGREKEGRAEAAEVLKISPKFSLDNHEMGLPFKDQSTLDKYIGNLRKAGLK
ncbi:MAG: tetratricopeptide repeat protein [Deltaproteobacteria bacterium]|nr:tetratricopeptide repeat protein [Deltaproteobacteria bacterium]